MSVRPSLVQQYNCMAVSFWGQTKTQVPSSSKRNTVNCLRVERLFTLVVGCMARYLTEGERWWSRCHLALAQYADGKLWWPVQHVNSSHSWGKLYPYSPFSTIQITFRFFLNQSFFLWGKKLSALESETWWDEKDSFSLYIRPVFFSISFKFYLSHRFKIHSDLAFIFLHKRVYKNI